MFLHSLLYLLSSDPDHGGPPEGLIHPFLVKHIDNAIHSNVILPLHVEQLFVLVFVND